jgi:hypothetical protein
VVVLRRRLDFGIKAAQMVKTLLTGVTHHLEGAALKIVKVTDEIRTPVPASYNSYFQFVVHTPRYYYWLLSWLW